MKTQESHPSPSPASSETRHRPTPIAWLRVAGTFAVELVQSAWATIRAVLGRPERLRPAILAVPLDARSDGAITLFASMVTLTPGTTSIDVSDDRKTLYVHVLDTDDQARTIADMKATLETRAREALP